MMSKTNTRAFSAKILNEVVKENLHFDGQIINARFSQLSPADRAFMAYLCYGVLRFYHRLAAFAQVLIPKPLKSKDADVYHLVLLGLYQLFYTDIPDYAIINETVEATQNLKKPWAKQFVNGVLRGAIEKKEHLLSLKSPEAKTAHPYWLIKKLQTDWSENYETIIEANLAHPRFTLRVNKNKITRDEYAQKLTAQKIQFELHPQCPEGIIIAEPIEAKTLPGFNEGLVSVQDGASQLAAHLLELAPNMRVLDACAAPGGKASHMKELEPSIELTAIEKNAQRVLSLNNTFKRLNITAQVVNSDASYTEQWWDGQLFDRILLDAPCTASGIINRHPDIKIHRQPEDIAKAVQEQQKLLAQLWPLLKPNGIFLYSTCSIFPEENVLQIEKFLENTPNAQEYPINTDWGIDQKWGRQILPGMHPLDGFYYMRMKKI